MRQLLAITGGYPRVANRLLDMQLEMLTMGNAMFGALGVDIVLSGCAVTDNGNGTVNIAAGIVYVGGQVVRFDAVTNIASDGSQAMALGGPVTSYPLTFGDGNPKNIYSEQKAVIVASTLGNNSQIKIKTTLYNLPQYIQDQVTANEPKGSIRELYDLDGSFLTNFSVSGLGIKAPWINWALDNGNNGTPGSAGMVTIGVGTYTDPISGAETTYAAEQTGGETQHLLTPSETATPAGTVPGLDGPHNKPSDGGGAHEYYVTGGLVAEASAVSAHNNMQPYKAVYRVVKIA